MSKPVKNQLQEIFMKKGVAIPSYSTTNRGGPPHQPLWSSVVTLYSGEVFEGDICHSKPEAENNAAQKALSSIRSEPPRPLSEGRRSNVGEGRVVKTKPRVREVRSDVVILIDLENKHNLPKEIERCPELSSIDVYIFVSENHSLVEKEWNSPNFVKIVCPGGRKDGTDTCIQVMTGKLLADGDYRLFLIGTGDHFGYTLVDSIRSDKMPWDPQEAHVVTSVSQILERVFV